MNGALPLLNSNVTNEKGTKEQRNKKKTESVAKEVDVVIEDDDLTEKQRLFCFYFIKLKNATKAYQRAYGCSYETAMVEGCKSLRKPKIKEKLDKLRIERLNSICLSTEDILQKYIDIAFADITEYVKFGRREVEMPDGTKVVNYVDIKESAEVDGTIISEISHGKNGVKVKLADKMRALDFLAKYNGMLSADVRERLVIERERLELSRPKDTDTREDKLDVYLEQLQGVFKDD